VSGVPQGFFGKLRMMRIVQIGSLSPQRIYRKAPISGMETLFSRLKLPVLSSTQLQSFERLSVSLHFGAPSFLYPVGRFKETYLEN
jgi:hypothetical protein